MTEATTNKSGTRIVDALWKLTDTLSVCVIILLGGCIVAFALSSSFDRGRVTTLIMESMVAALTIFSPIIWLRKRYGVPLGALGLQRGRFTIPTSIFIGAMAAVIWSVLSSLFLYRWSTHIVVQALLSPHYFYILKVLAPNGFASFVLAPASEEVLFRGFIYGYLRKKCGIAVGLAIQATLFSLIHFIGFQGVPNLFIPGIAVLIIGLILGILYERTGSLLPSMVMHGVYNYLSFVLGYITTPH